MRDSMSEYNELQYINDLWKEKIEKKEDFVKMIEEVEQKAFMAGYDYAIEVLKAGRVNKKQDSINK